MRWRSLRFRLIVGGVAAILIALSAAGGGLVLLFERHVARTIAGDLDVFLKQVIAGINVDADGRIVVTSPPPDPRFSQPLSGLYWQVTSADGQLLRSRSLWDTSLKLAADTASSGREMQEVAGPAGARLLLVDRRVSLMIGNKPVALAVGVATDLGRVSVARAAFARELGIALVLLGAVLAAATAVQVTLGLRPLDRLRRSIADIRSGHSLHVPRAAPAEVQPLVEELNALLDMQHREIERSRSRAEDLAHGLKTPLAALASDVHRLRDRGEYAIARDIDAVSQAMRRHVDRELTRARVRGVARWGPRAAVELAPLVHGLIAVLARTRSGGQIGFEMNGTENVVLPFDRTDLAEILGNLLENAFRHAASRVRISAEQLPAGMSVVVEDDGKGIAPPARSEVMQRGLRLDQCREGAGLGLAIVLDILEEYDWTLVLGESTLGGLKATIAPRDITAVPGSAAGSDTVLRTPPAPTATADRGLPPADLRSSPALHRAGSGSCG